MTDNRIPLAFSLAQTTEEMNARMAAKRDAEYQAMVSKNRAASMHCGGDAFTGIFHPATPTKAAMLEHAAPLAPADECSVWKQNSIDTWAAMTTMRNDINEHIPMPSIEGDMLRGPENSIFCASVAAAVITHIKGNSKCSIQTERATGANTNGPRGSGAIALAAGVDEPLNRWDMVVIFSAALSTMIALAAAAVLWMI